MDTNILRKFFAHSPFAYSIVKVIYDEQGTPIDYIVLSINQAYEQLMGLKKETICGRRFYEIYPQGWEGEADWIKVQQKAICSRQVYPFDIFRAEMQKWIRVTTFPIDNDIFGFIHHDVTNEYMMDKEIEGAFKVNIDVLCISNEQGILIKANKAFERTLGYSTEEMAGKNLLNLVHEEDIIKTKEAMNKFGEEQQLSSFINRIRTKGGEYRYLEWHCRPIGNYIYSSARDVTEKIKFEKMLQDRNESLKQLTDKLKNLAIKDELTGLYNRHYLYERIDGEIKRADREQYPISMIIFDLDHFKRVNDNWGHPVGDEVLKEIAKLVPRYIDNIDFLVRFGGEEFLAILVGKTATEAEKIAEKMRAAIETYEFHLVGRLTASFGVTEKGQFEHFYNWYKRADEALYCSKKCGRNRVTVINYNSRCPCNVQQVRWKKELETGITIIDEQHRGLFETANRLLNVSSSNIGLETSLRIVEQAIEQIEVHFRTEEKILEEKGYSQTEEHQQEHAELLNTAKKLKTQYENGEIELSDFYTFMVNKIIIEHTHDCDQSFVPYVNV